MPPAGSDLPEGLQRGDPSALEAVYRALHPGVLAYLRAHGADEPEDLASDTFVALARSLPDFEGDWSALRALTFTIARHRVIDEGRKRVRRRTEPVDMQAILESAGAADVESQALSRLGVEAARALIASLPATQAEVLLLRVLGDLSVEETALIIGKRPGAVRAIQHRALRRLAAQLGEDA
ncbi:MAG: sigma-70 family RNA polymerase sigma factor [Actinobacteria bacterium]|nr:sigma-70 family RNA polymerase sigma factor [Actinomycetota bacterium]